MHTQQTFNTKTKTIEPKQKYSLGCVNKWGMGRSLHAPNIAPSFWSGSKYSVRCSMII